MYGKNLSGHTSLVLRPIKALLLLLFPAFEGLHDNIKFVIIACIQRKLFKGNDRQGECEQTIVKYKHSNVTFNTPHSKVGTFEGLFKFSTFVYALVLRYVCRSIEASFFLTNAHLKIIYLLAK